VKVEINRKKIGFGHGLHLSAALIMHISLEIEIHKHSFGQIVPDAAVVFVVDEHQGVRVFDFFHGELYFLVGAVEVGGYDAGDVLSVLLYM
jgi:hypothetical protein